jgi:hypothetical protein
MASSFSGSLSGRDQPVTLAEVGPMALQRLLLELFYTQNNEAIIHDLAQGSTVVEV